MMEGDVREELKVDGERLWDALAGSGYVQINFEDSKYADLRKEFRLALEYAAAAFYASSGAGACDLDLDALEAVARAATEQREWVAVDGLLKVFAGPPDARGFARRTWVQATPRDRDHIAAFDPPTVLKLIAAARSVRPPEVTVRVDGGSSGAESARTGTLPVLTSTPCQSERDLIPRADAVEACSEWLRQYADKEITFTSARQHASDAVMDIRDHICSIQSSDPVKTEAWSAIIDRIVPALSPMSDAAANRYPAEWTLWKDRERIRAELSALQNAPPPADAAPQARKSGQAREEQQNPPPKETTGKVEGEG